MDEQKNRFRLRRFGRRQITEDLSEARRATLLKKRAVDAEKRFKAHILQEKEAEKVQRIGLADSIWTDIYHHLLTMGWAVFLVWSVVIYIGINLFFALLYLGLGAHVTGARPGHINDLFFFSVQTFSTVGYGVMAPVGGAANTICLIEVYMGIMVNALVTGAVFARFARPRARVLFSSKAVISCEHGTPALCIRIANCRRSALLSVDVELSLSRLVMGENGHPVRRFEPMQLQQSHIPLLRFAFVLGHVIDASSPLSEHEPGLPSDDEAEVMVTVTGIDEATGQSMLARASYRFEHVDHGHRFVDIVDVREGGKLSVDFRRFHDTEEEVLWKDEDGQAG
ncbi:ATP-sensitive potassium channel protein [Brytella acorum]|uniref:ATP-sensitive potassium channel protein n=1 Tax=Brytella acorum TaxID=2959299 RepID=A0AA35V1Z1_9PROT|nr:ATP-sensitive potassium channel protein [Brytella acorum]MDF3624256.1 ATP-sensitive potassium channel protein [Brytella acorum]CAI9121170.1 ATP-sensitive potassium channel protein [Brytella acorum]